MVTDRAGPRGGAPFWKREALESGSATDRTVTFCIGSERHFMTLSDLIRTSRVAADLRERIAASRFVVTGPTGWIGSAFLAFLAEVMGDNLSSHVSVFGSRSSVLPAKFGGLTVQPLSELNGPAVRDRIVLHLAYITREKIGNMPAADYVAGNLRIDERVLAAVREGRAAGVFVASSGIAADVERGGTRDLYGLTKLVQEDAFGRLRVDLDVPVLIARIFNISGPFANKPEHYALANFLLQGIQHKQIVIKARTLVFRSFLDVLDLVAVVLATLVDGRYVDGVVDACGSQILEMREIADEAARALDLSLDSVMRPEVDPSEASFYFGNPVRFASLATQSGLALSSFSQQVRVQAEDGKGALLRGD